MGDGEAGLRSVNLEAYREGEPDRHRATVLTSGDEAGQRLYDADRFGVTGCIDSLHDVLFTHLPVRLDDEA